MPVCRIQNDVEGVVRNGESLFRAGPNPKRENRAAAEFAAITVAPETRPFQPAQQLFLKEPEIFKRRGDRRLLKPVWVATQGLELELKSELRTVTRNPPGVGRRPVWADAHDPDLELKKRISDRNPKPASQFQWQLKTIRS